MDDIWKLFEEERAATNARFEMLGNAIRQAIMQEKQKPPAHSASHLPAQQETPQPTSNNQDLSSSYSVRLPTLPPQSSPTIPPKVAIVARDDQTVQQGVIPESVETPPTKGAPATEEPALPNPTKTSAPNGEPVSTSDGPEHSDKEDKYAKTGTGWTNLPDLAPGDASESTTARPRASGGRVRKRRNLIPLLGATDQSDVNLIKAKARKYIAEKHDVILKDPWTKGPYTELHRLRLKRSLVNNFGPAEGLTLTMDIAEAVLSSIALDRSKNDEVARKRFLRKRGIIVTGRNPKGYTKGLIAKWYAENGGNPGADAGKPAPASTAAPATSSTAAAKAGQGSAEVTSEKPESRSEPNEEPKPTDNNKSTATTKEPVSPVKPKVTKTINNLGNNGLLAKTTPQADRQLQSETETTLNDKPAVNAGAVPAKDLKGAADDASKENEEEGAADDVYLDVRVGDKIHRLDEEIISSNKAYLTWAKKAFPEWDPEKSFLKMLPINPSLYDGEAKTANFLDEIWDVSDEWENAIHIFHEREYFSQDSDTAFPAVAPPVPQMQKKPDAVAPPPSKPMTEMPTSTKEPKAALAVAAPKEASANRTDPAGRSVLKQHSKPDVSPSSVMPPPLTRHSLGNPSIPQKPSEASPPARVSANQHQGGASHQKHSNLPPPSSQAPRVALKAQGVPLPAINSAQNVDIEKQGSDSVEKWKAGVLPRSHIPASRPIPPNATGAVNIPQSLLQSKTTDQNRHGRIPEPNRVDGPQSMQPKPSAPRGNQGQHGHVGQQDMKGRPSVPGHIVKPHIQSRHGQKGHAGHQGHPPAQLGHHGHHGRTVATEQQRQHNDRHEKPVPQPQTKRHHQQGHHGQRIGDPQQPLGLQGQTSHAAHSVAPANQSKPQGPQPHINRNGGIGGPPQNNTTQSAAGGAMQNRGLLPGKVAKASGGATNAVQNAIRHHYAPKPEAASVQVPSSQPAAEPPNSTETGAQPGFVRTASGWRPLTPRGHSEGQPKGLSTIMSGALPDKRIRTPSQARVQIEANIAIQDQSKARKIERKNTVEKRKAGRDQLDESEKIRRAKHRRGAPAEEW